MFIEIKMSYEIKILFIVLKDSDKLLKLFIFAGERGMLFVVFLSLSVMPMQRLS